MASDPNAADAVNWDRHFVIGSVVDASVHEQKDYGLVFDFAAHADVLGLAAKHQVRVRACVRACVRVRARVCVHKCACMCNSV